MNALSVRPLKTRTVVVLSALAVAAAFLGANAHMLYVALISQPECVDHARAGDAGNGTFRAAKSSCSPGARP